MRNLSHRNCSMIALLILLVALSGCGPAPAAASGMTSAVPVEPDRASAAPSVPGPAKANDSSMADTLHITWMFYEEFSDANERKHLSALEDALNRSGWHVKLDWLQERYKFDLGGFATDAYVTPYKWQAEGLQMDYANPDKLLERGATMDVTPLCAQYVPVLAQMNADLLTPAGVPLDIQRDANRNSLYLLLLRDQAPQQWLAVPPNMSEIISWVEGGDVSLGRVAPEGSSAVPFQLALQAWAGEQGFYPLSCFAIYGGFYAKVGDVAMQPVPMESIPGFDDIYRRLYALYKAGKYFEADTRAVDTVGYLSHGYVVQEGFLKARGITAGDIVAVPVQCAAWEEPSSSVYDGPMLAIPTNSQHVQQALELIQWALTTREGYDLVSYGILTKDYTMQNDCLQWIEGSGMSYPGLQFVYDSNLDRLNRPANAADITRIMAYTKLPLLDLSGVDTYDKTQYASPLQAIMQPIRQDNAKLVNDRENLLMGLLPAVEGKNVQPITSADAALEQLRAMSKGGAVGRLADTYAAELLKLTKE